MFLRRGMKLGSLEDIHKETGMKKPNTGYLESESCRLGVLHKGLLTAITVLRRPWLVSFKSVFWSFLRTGKRGNYYPR